MQRTLIRTVLLASMLMGSAGLATAQGRGRSATAYPPGFKPPAGMCRVWLPGVPPGRQPGVTDCASARAMAPSNAQIIYGDRNDDPSYRGRTGTYTRTVYDAYGNRVTQRLRRNSDGTVTVIGTSPYRVSTGVNGKTLPGYGQPDYNENTRGAHKGHAKREKKEKDKDKDKNHDNDNHRDHH